MLFHSAAFIFLFLPPVLTGYYALYRWRGQNAAFVWLACASVFFYGYWDPRFVFLLVLSITINAAILNRMAASRVARRREIWFWLGLAANFGSLAYFKYANFFLDNLQWIVGADWRWERIVLPIGISFFTFQQITLLVDARREGWERPKGLLHHTVFIAFFPQLIAGPIVHHREMMPQFDANPARNMRDNLETGLTLFALGLAKKVLIADTLALVVNPVFAAAAQGAAAQGAAAQGAAPGLPASWAAMAGYTFQLYFDFSGYSDMALGCALLFGVRLPINFASPLKSRSIVEFWSRWHISLSRLIMAYLHTPMALMAMRRGGGARRRLSPFSPIITGPLMITFLLAGLWHGAGWNFLLFGLIHGLAVVVVHAWRERRRPLPPWAAWSLTFLVLNLSLIPFRADDLATAGTLFLGLLGLNGWGLGQGLAQIQTVIPGVAAFPAAVGATGPVVTAAGLEPWAIGAFFLALPVLLAIALLAPNSAELLGPDRPGLASQGYPATRIPTDRPPPWPRSLVGWWASAVMLVSLGAIFSREALAFVYFQF